MTTTITNTPVNRHVTNAEIEQFFADEIIDITGTKLSIKRDEDGRIMEVVVDADMSDTQISMFKAAFFYTENTLEEIGRVDSLTGRGSINVPLSKNKKHLRVIFIIHRTFVFDIDTKRSIQLTFNNSQSANNNQYHTSTDGNGDSCVFDAQGSTLCSGKILISNYKDQVKSGTIENYSSHAKNGNNINFKWKNNTDYINNIYFKLNSSSITGNDSTVVVEGWD